MTGNAFNIKPIFPAEMTLQQLLDKKRELYKDRDSVRNEIIRNGNETFQKYGSEFTYTHTESIEKIENELQQRLTSQRIQMSEENRHG